jgi:acetate kinase
MSSGPAVLTINRGSSSLKFAVYDLGIAGTGGTGRERLVVSGAVDRIGAGEGQATLRSADGHEVAGRHAVYDSDAAISWLLGALDRQNLTERVAAVGHRLVHGGARYRDPVRITPTVRRELDTLIPLAPEHLPNELHAIDAIARHTPSLPQVACFDTAFHATLPRVARLFGLPRALAEEGIVRYGFHGISYEYVVSALRELGALGRRTVIAHLGNGASLAAVLDGASIDTTMGFTPAGGVIMGTRSGDLDPGIIVYLQRTGGQSVDGIDKLVNETGGLLGLSGTTSDMRELLDRADTDPHASEAIAVFCYQVRKAVGAYAAALGGLDTLVFTGGIGAHAPAVREQICERLDYAGVRLDRRENDANASVISEHGAAVDVRIAPTNEELMIARHVRTVVSLNDHARG